MGIYGIWGTLFIQIINKGKVRKLWFQYLSPYLITLKWGKGGGDPQGSQKVSLLFVFIFSIYNIMNWGIVI